MTNDESRYSFRDRFTAEGREAMNRCSDIVQRYGHTVEDTEHLLLALVEQANRVVFSTVSAMFTALNVNAYALANRLDETLRLDPLRYVQRFSGNEIFLSKRMIHIMEQAEEIAKQLHDPAISSEHLFIAILREQDTAADRILQSFNLKGWFPDTVIWDMLAERKPTEADTSSTVTEESRRKVQALNVFLCHSSGDKPKVRELYRRLLKDRINPWLDEENLLPGQDWQTEIQKAVRNSDVVIVCLSKSSITKAGYVQKEIKYALDVAEEQPDETIFIIPLKLEECDIPDRLSRWQWVNLFEDNSYQRVMRSLHRCAEAKSKR